MQFFLFQELSEYQRINNGNRFTATSYKKAALALNECAEKVKSGADAMNIVIFKKNMNFERLFFLFLKERYRQRYWC